jgi:predicted ATP-grasp superfamily ATP-dependent carboligase
VLVVAATSARMLAQSARRGGFRPIALDMFGDLDTRRAAHWVSIADPRAKEFDGQRIQDALTRLASRPGVLGWVAGGGFEDRLDLMDRCAQALPLIGNGPAAVAAIKDPVQFFGMLDQYGIEHPETRMTPPPESVGWLSKRVGGTGGWHVKRLQPLADRPGSAEAGEARSARARTSARDSMPPGQATPNGESACPGGTSANPLPPASYYQRELSGVPMSVLFLANGKDISLVGFNRLLFAASRDRPFVFHGAVGPVALPKAVEGPMREAVARIARHVGLRGLNSMDFLLAEGRISVLEVNPRPSATLELHDDRLRGGLMHAHLAACGQGALPDEGLARQPSGVNGLRVVYARSPLLATRRGRAQLQALDWCHDIGREGTRTGRGQPLCTVSARAETEQAVIEQLAQRASAIERIHEEENDER